MSDLVRIELLPLGKIFHVPRGAWLEDALFAHGVEFPCGGKGRCRGCKIKILSGLQPPSPDDLAKFSPDELAQGWRLSCRTRAEHDLKIELAQWEAAILTDDSIFTFEPQQGFGVAVDLGTTTLVAQLVDLRSGQVRAVRTALNPQARYGADIMSRIECALSGNQSVLTQVIRSTLGELILGLMEAGGIEDCNLKRICLVGNTAMHHLFCGIDVEPLSHVPFEPQHHGLQKLSGQELGWTVPESVEIFFLPCVAGFVGSDILAGIVATGLHKSTEVAALVDLGTNGEIVVGNGERMLCASTAAGPAFEGARISMGMRATTGAISEVSFIDGQFKSRVLGNGEPVGLCGSGLVDAVAASLESGRIKPSGRIVQGEFISIAPPVTLTQRDIRELQYAKGAIAAGIRILLQQWGAAMEELSRVYLAGAFGNYINRSSALRIGLLPFPLERIHVAGNTALLGAKLALFNPAPQEFHYRDILRKLKHVSLNEDLDFQTIYAEEMGF